MTQPARKGYNFKVVLLGEGKLKNIRTNHMLGQSIEIINYSTIDAENCIHLTFHVLKKYFLF